MVDPRATIHFQKFSSNKRNSQSFWDTQVKWWCVHAKNTYVLCAMYWLLLALKIEQSERRPKWPLHVQYGCLRYFAVELFSKQEILVQKSETYFRIWPADFIFFLAPLTGHPV